jgi:hypothetical protein
MLYLFRVLQSYVNKLFSPKVAYPEIKCYTNINGIKIATIRDRKSHTGTPSRAIFSHFFLFLKFSSLFFQMGCQALPNRFSKTRFSHKHAVRLPVLRIRDVYPGSPIRLFSIPDPNCLHPGSRSLIKEFKYFNPKKSKIMVSKL